ncbi:MAG: zinc ribbon domain-containing protein [Candidatus Schekmanbacteria bacterium]|nr:MAG: zinc ribbon domain-containing protein [Candidatus Schekmanbacteria bacterium]
MPVYEYECQDCKEEFEYLLLSKDSKIHCPKCNGEHIIKKMSLCGFASGDKFTSSSPGGSACSGCTSTNCSTCK